jgi:hypothetical protein
MGGTATKGSLHMGKHFRVIPSLVCRSGAPIMFPSLWSTPGENEDPLSFLDASFWMAWLQVDVVSFLQACVEICNK